MFGESRNPEPSVDRLQTVRSQTKVNQHGPRKTNADGQGTCDRRARAIRPCNPFRISERMAAAADIGVHRFWLALSLLIRRSAGLFPGRPVCRKLVDSLARRILPQYALFIPYGFFGAL